MYSGPPQCQGCGGRLMSDGEVCLCGGKSQYYERAEDAPARRMAAAELRWQRLMGELRDHYAGP